MLEEFRLDHREVSHECGAKEETGDQEVVEGGVDHGESHGQEDDIGHGGEDPAQSLAGEDATHVAGRELAGQSEETAFNLKNKVKYNTMTGSSQLQFHKHIQNNFIPSRRTFR